MPFEVATAVNGIADKICNNPLVSSVVYNPIFMALLVSCIVVVIVLAMYYNKFKSQGWKKAARLFIFLLISTSALIFVHHYAVCRKTRMDMSRRDIADVFQGIEQSRRFEGSNTPVVPAVSPLIPVTGAGPGKKVQFSDGDETIPTSGETSEENVGTEEGDVSLSERLKIDDLNLPAQ